MAFHTHVSAKWTHALPVVFTKHRLVYTTQLWRVSFLNCGDICIYNAVSTVCRPDLVDRNTDADKLGEPRHRDPGSINKRAGPHARVLLRIIRLIMASEQSVFAFFGATGGCANACLALTLKNGYRATALARTPSKLTNMLKEQGLDEQTINSNLDIVEGSITDVTAVKRTLFPNNKLVSKIVFGIGGTPKLQLSLFTPITLDNPTVCTDGVNSISKALRDVYEQNGDVGKPLIVVVSSTGTKGAKDIPKAYTFWYHGLLSVPHSDKTNMEKAVLYSASELFNGTVIVRPTLLTGDQNISSADQSKVKAGTEKNPAIGYTISRADVGQWIFDQVINVNSSNWVGEKVTLTT